MSASFATAPRQLLSNRVPEEYLSRAVLSSAAVSPLAKLRRAGAGRKHDPTRSPGTRARLDKKNQRQQVDRACDETRGAGIGAQGAGALRLHYGTSR